MNFKSTLILILLGVLSFTAFGQHTMARARRIEATPVFQLSSDTRYYGWGPIDSTGDRNLAYYCRTNGERRWSRDYTIELVKVSGDSVLAQSRGSGSAFFSHTSRQIAFSKYTGTSFDYRDPCYKGFYFANDQLTSITAERCGEDNSNVTPLLFIESRNQYIDFSQTNELSCYSMDKQLLWKHVIPDRNASSFSWFDLEMSAEESFVLIRSGSTIQCLDSLGVLKWEYTGDLPRRDIIMTNRAETRFYVKTNRSNVWVFDQKGQSIYSSLPAWEFNPRKKVVDGDAIASEYDIYDYKSEARLHRLSYRMPPSFKFKSSLYWSRNAKYVARLAQCSSMTSSYSRIDKNGVEIQVSDTLRCEDGVYAINVCSRDGTENYWFNIDPLDASLDFVRAILNVSDDGKYVTLAVPNEHQGMFHAKYELQLEPVDLISQKDQPRPLMQVVDFPRDENAEWWVLVHSNRSSEPNKILLYDIESHQIKKTLSLPQYLTSPHALAFDGVAIWVGGMSMHATIYQIDPNTNEVINSLFNIRTQGLAVTDSSLWCVDQRSWSNDLYLSEYDFSGREIQKHLLDPMGIVDLAIINNDFFYSVNDADDKIVHTTLNPWREDDLINPAVKSTSISTLSSRNGVLYVVDDKGRNRLLRSYDPYSRELVGVDTLKIEGWIRAIAPNKIQ